MSVDRATLAAASVAQSAAESAAASALSAANAVTFVVDELDDAVASAVADGTVSAAAAATSAETARTGAETARDEAIDISNITIDDDIVEVLIKPGVAGPKTKVALSAAIAEQNEIQVPPLVAESIAADATVVAAAADAVDGALDTAGLWHDVRASEDNSTQFVDAQGLRSWLEIGPDGKPTSHAASKIAAAIPNIPTDLDFDTSGYVFTLMDTSGRLALGVLPSGRVTIPSLTLSASDNPHAWTKTVIIPVIGQSNSVAYGQPLTAYDQPHPDVFMIPQFTGDTRTPIPAANPVRTPWTTGTSGENFGVQFAKRYANQHPGTRVVLLVLGRDGTGFYGSDPYTWATDRPAVTNQLLATAVSRVQEAQTLLATDTGKALPVEIGPTLWHQGESDGNAQRTQAQYATDLDNLIAYWRAQLPAAATKPFIVLPMLRELIEFYGPTSQPSATYTAVKYAHEDTPRRVLRTAYVEQFPIGWATTDDVHGSSAWHQELARIAFEEAVPRAYANIATTQRALGPQSLKATQDTATTVAVEWKLPRTQYTGFEVDFRLNGGAWTAVTRPNVCSHYATVTPGGAGRVEVRVRSTGATASRYSYVNLNTL